MRWWGDGSVRKALFYVLFPIRKRACHHTAEDKVKTFRVGPGLFQIIDLEFDVWWHA